MNYYYKNKKEVIIILIDKNSKIGFHSFIINDIKELTLKKLEAVYENVANSIDHHVGEYAFLHENCYVQKAKMRFR